jgi:tetratricopeptide (TPR) repeat protein
LSASLHKKLGTARALLQNGDSSGVQAICAEVLRKAPRNPEALGLRGAAFLMSGNAAAAAEDFRLALSVIPGDGPLLEHLGLALLNLGRFPEAEQPLKQAAGLPGVPASVPMRLGLALLLQHKTAEALPHLRKALALAPDNPDCLLALGRGLAAAGDSEGAAGQFEALLRRVPAHPDALFNLGVLALNENRLDVARGFFERLVSLHPGHADGMVNLALAVERLGDPGHARSLLAQALGLAPAHPQANANLGRLQLQDGQFDQARRHFDAALASAPRLSVAMEGLGGVARALNRHREAVHWLQQLTELDPESPASTWAALADSRLQVGDLQASATAAERAAALDPDSVWAWSLRAQLKLVERDLAAAIALLEEGSRRTGNAVLLGMLGQCCRQACDWPRWSEAWAALKPRLLAGEEAGTPFALLSEDLTAAELCAYTRDWAARRFGNIRQARLPEAIPPAAGERLRIGYLSSDFQEHPAAYLITEMLELHDREAFEIHAYSYGPASDSAMRQRIVAAVDHFADIAWEADDRAYERIREDRIDILVDLKGYTVGDRIGIMARRAAPVQVTWLGYPGTTGSTFIDYLIADPFIIAAGEDGTCTERVLRMPHCYQPIDRRRTVAEARPRAAYGLPEQGMVLCCFNQAFKITPLIHAAWMRLLQALPGSVLWLVDDNRWATANLKAATADAGVDPGRLVFAPRLPLAEHLARYQVADLALDTFPYTSHTTASDALWCGCPLVALCGDTFAARVSGSILTAAGIPELIARSPAEYETTVLQLGRDPALLETLRGRIRDARGKAPLFDTAAFTRELESLYRQMLAARTAA